MRWGLLLALALGMRLAGIARNATIVNDGVFYIEMAELMAKGEWARAMATDYHPAYPFLMMLAGAAMPYEAAGYAVSIAAALATLPLLWRLLREAAGEATAWMGAVLYAVHPTLTRFQSEVIANSLFILLFIAGVVVLLRILQGRGLGHAVALAAITVSAYLTRSEGLLLGVFSIVAIAVRWVGLRRAGRLNEAARLVPAGAILAGAAALATLGIAASGRMTSTLSSLFGIVLSGGYGPSPAGAKEMVDETAYSLNPSLWILAIVGTPLLRRNLASMLVVLVALAFFAVMTVGFSIVGYTGRHYYLPAAALLLLPASAGVLGVAALAERTSRLLACGLVVLLCAGLVSAVFRPVRYSRVPYRMAGEWIRETYGPGQVIFSDEPQAAYYARSRGWVLQNAPERFLSRVGELVVVESHKLDARVIDAKGLKKVREFPGSVNVYVIGR